MNIDIYIGILVGPDMDKDRNSGHISLTDQNVPFGDFDINITACSGASGLLR